jgi:hypothetical protein
MEFVEIRVREVEDGWTLSIGAHGAPARHGHVPLESVLHVAAAAEDLLASDGDAALTKAEAAVSRALAEAIEASGGPGDVLWRAASRTEARREPLVIVLDADERQRALPWELLAIGARHQPLEVEGRGAVVRLVRHAPPPSEVGPGPLHVVVGRLGMDAPELDVALDALKDACQASGLPDPGGLDVGSGPRVVTLLGGDTADMSCGALLTAQVRTPGDQLLAGASLVVLASCGFGDGRAVRNLAARAVLAGAHVAIHTDGGLAPPAIAAFLAGLHTSLGRGQDPLVALAAARRAVHALHPDMLDWRWWRFRMLVGTPDVLATPPRPPRWRPQSWPTPAHDAADLIDRAFGLADPSGGFVGVEHLAAAWVSRVPPGHDPLADEMRTRVDAWMRRLSQLSPREETPFLEPRPTPRLLALAGVLQEGFTTSDLWDALLSDTGAWGRWFVDPNVLRRLAPTAHRASDLAGLGGPEDGRRLDLTPEDVLGRASPGRPPGPALYQDTAVSDPRLSRRHLRWILDGSVEVLANMAAVHNATQSAASPEGTLSVRVGDRLELTDSTWLVGVGPRESRAP